MSAEDDPLLEQRKGLELALSQVLTDACCKTLEHLGEIGIRLLALVVFECFETLSHARCSLMTNVLGNEADTNALDCKV